MMVLGTTAAFAGDSDALKAILKAKTYAEAQSLLNSNLSTLANNEEKAKAYNKLVDLALTKVENERSTIIDNQTAQQLGQAGDKAVDEEGMYEALSVAVDAAYECYNFDQMPNEKGKVKPKFSKDIATRLYPLRPFLINGGGFYQGKDDNKAYSLLTKYIESANAPLFKDVKGEDKDLSNAAFFASYMALNNKEYATAEKYAEMALNDPERGADAQKIQLAAMQGQLTTHADSVAYMNKLEGLYAKDSNNEVVFSTLCSLYSNMNQAEKADKLIDSQLAADPNNYAALMMKGQVESQKKNYDAAAENLEKALAQAKDDDSKIALNAAIGECYFFKAQDRVNNYKGVLSPAAREQFNVVYNKAIKYLEEAKNLDIMKEHKRSWAYPLYGSYYFVKGLDAAETQQAAADAGVTQ